MKIYEENNTIQVSGFIMDDVVFVSSADNMYINNDDTVEREKLKKVKVIIEIEDLDSWINKLYQKKYFNK